MDALHPHPPGSPQLPPLTDQIRRDLAAARDDDWVRPMIDPASPASDPEIVRWLRDNP